jgi:endonuclease/exonuclease/phosphatase family metal-dependent hydrolase
MTEDAMRSWKSTALALMLAALLTIVQTPASAGDEPSTSRAPGRVSVMTLNMYIGADLSPLRAIQNPEDLPGVVAEVWEQFLATKITERVKAMAGLIRVLRPDLIGLQEATLIRTQDPSDFFSPNGQPAKHVAYDFVALLLNALEQSRSTYRAVARSQNFDVELPRANVNRTLTDVRITDRDVILARDDVDIDPRSITAQNYDAHLQFGSGPTSVPILRGFVAVDATVGSTTYRFATTHLEAGTFPPSQENIRVEQVKELIEALDQLDEKKSLPLIVVGDFNVEAGDAYVPMLKAEYEDTWTERVGAPAEGLTCCQDSTLLNRKSLLDERIDLIFARDISLQRVIARTGLDKPGQRTPSGLWPSDHAAVFASLLGRGRPLARTGIPDASGMAAGR